MLNQRLQLKLSQKLSPQQIQLMKLIQLPVQELEQRLSREIEENPALEAGKENEESINEDSEDYNDEIVNEDEINVEDYLSDDDVPARGVRVSARALARTLSRISSSAQAMEPVRQSFFSSAASNNTKLEPERFIHTLRWPRYLRATVVTSTFRPVLVEQMVAAAGA